MISNSKCTPEQLENRRLWVEALRSGDYRQGTNALCVVDEQGETFCCLGVAADVVIEGDWIYSTMFRQWRLIPDDRFALPCLATMLDPETLRSLGMDPLDQEALVDANDDAKSSSGRSLTGSRRAESRRSTTGTETSGRVDTQMGKARHHCANHLSTRPVLHGGGRSPRGARGLHDRSGAPRCDWPGPVVGRTRHSHPRKDNR